MFGSAARDLVSSLAILAAGLLMAHEVGKLTIWTDGEPRQGFFPLLIAVAIIGLSAAIAFGAIIARRRPGDRAGEPDDGGSTVTASGLGKVALYLTAMFAYALLLDRFGFVAVSVAFTVGILLFIERQTVKISVLVGLASVLVGYLVFVQFLKVPLPP